MATLDGTSGRKRATLEQMTESETLYYERRAAEYDDWYRGTGLFAARVRPGWHKELEGLE